MDRVVTGERDDGDTVLKARAVFIRLTSGIKNGKGVAPRRVTFDHLPYGHVGTAAL